MRIRRRFSDVIDAFAFAAEAVLPIFLLIGTGYLLKQLQVVADGFWDMGNKLTFRVFLPVMLFCNVYRIARFRDIHAPFILFGAAAILGISLLAAGITCLFTRDNAKRGALIQAMFRSNYAIIGIPLATSLFGEQGAAAAGVMSAFCVPLFNILSVVTLTYFHRDGVHPKPDIRKMLHGILTNPLILGTAAGLVCLAVREGFLQCGIRFRLSDVTWLYQSLESIKAACTPFALLVLGGKFRFSAVSRLVREILFGTLFRSAAVPAIGLSAAYCLRHLLHLSGEHFAVYVSVFATPAAVASAVMAKEMGADEELAGQLVVWTSLAGIVTIFICVTVLRQNGIL